MESRISFNRESRRECVVDAGVHMVSKMELSEELHIVKVSRFPTVIAANGSFDTEEATAYVKDVDMFVTVQLFEGTPAVLYL